jgi:hypothetical protein
VTAQDSLRYGDFTPVIFPHPHPVVSNLLDAACEATSLKNPIRITVLALVIVAVGIALFAVIAGFRVRTEAKSALSDLSGLQQSDDPTAAFEVLKRKYGNRLQPAQGCLPQDCQYLMTISNRSVSVLHLAPYAELRLWYNVYKTSLTLAMVEYRVALPRGNSPVVHVQVGMCAHGCGVRFDVNPHGRSEQMWNGLVDLDTRDTQEERDAAFALNLDCLMMKGRCTDITNLLPRVWSRTGPTAVQSRLMGLSQDLEESHLPTSSYE